MSITGTHLVRALRPALQEAKHFWPSVGDWMEVRRNALKLRFWGNRHGDEAATTVLDVSYETIKALPNAGVYEARLEDMIGGHRNIRIIFLEPPGSWQATSDQSLPIIWVLSALPKKRTNWTRHDIERFDARRSVVRSRFYR